MTDAELIKALGGPTVLATRMGMRVQAVSNWSTRGIPPDYHIKLWGMAVERSLDWSPPDSVRFTLSIKDQA